MTRKNRRLHEHRQNEAEHTAFQDFLADGLRTTHQQKQTREQMCERAMRAQDAMRERLSGVTKPLVHAEPVHRFSCVSRETLARFFAHRLIPATLLVMILVTGSMAMPATGTFNVNPQIKTNENGVSFIAPEDSVQLDGNASNMIFKEIAEEIGAPCFHLTQYVDSIFCLQKTIVPESNYALITLSVDSKLFHLEFETVDSDFSKPIPVRMEELASMQMDEENTFIIYHDTTADEDSTYTAYLIQSNFVLSVTASVTLDAFTLFLKHLTIVA